MNTETNITARQEPRPTFRKRSKVDFPEDWKMTYAQRRWYWSMVHQLAELEHWSKNELEEKRREFHKAAGLGPVSAKAINHTSDFDAIIGEFLARTQPDNLEAQIHLIKMPLIRLRTRIKCMAPEAYRRAIIQDRFGKKELEELDETELTQLRNTLEARARASRRHNEEAANISSGSGNDLRHTGPLHSIPADNGNRVAEPEEPF